jgi:hypothetical protein
MTGTGFGGGGGLLPAGSVIAKKILKNYKY